MSQSLTSQIFSGGASRAAAKRLTLALIREGFSERYLYEMEGEPKGPEAPPVTSDVREEDRYITEAPPGGGNVILGSVSYEGEPMQAVLIVSHVYLAREEEVTRVTGSFHMTPHPVEVTEA